MTRIVKKIAAEDEFIDPICGMTVDPATTPHHAALYAVLKPHRAGTPKIG